MGCGSCGSKKMVDGKPAGCGSKGNCTSGGCNKMNVFNWLAELPLSDPSKPYPIMEVSFNQGSRKEFFNNTTHLILEKGEMITVEGVGGIDVGQVSLTGELVRLQLKKYSVEEDEVTKKVLRHASDRDLEFYNLAKDREKESLIRSRAIAKQLNLEMKIAEVEIQADGKKVTFFYTADTRVDFRELIKVFASEFKAKVEMKQIGARQESAKVGGIGSCGRELCCSSWLTDFKTVNTTAARYQNLSINQTKLSGQCGRLKCCLNYELDTYLDALSVFPEHIEHLEVKMGKAHLIKKDIFRNLMWFSFNTGSKHYPLTIERVTEIAELNKKGIIPDDLEAIELRAANKNQGSNIDIGFVNDVGQLTLSSLNKNSRKKSKPKPNGAPSTPVKRTAAERAPVERQPAVKSESTVPRNRPNPNRSVTPKDKSNPTSFRNKRNNPVNKDINRTKPRSTPES